MKGRITIAAALAQSAPLAHNSCNPDMTQRHDYVHQAVAIAKQIPGTPVKLIWSREEDMTHGRHHPLTQAKMVRAFDANNISPRCTCASPANQSWPS